MTTYTLAYPTLRPEDVVVLREIAAANTYENIWLNAYAEYIHNDDGSSDYKGIVVACREVKMPGCDPDRVTRRHEITAKVRVERYNDDGTSPGCARYSAVSSHYQSSDRSALRTLANMVKSGDCLTIHFLIGNTSENLKKVDMTHDECYLTVARRKGTSNTWKLIGDIYVDDVTAPVGSFARMGYR